MKSARVLLTAIFIFSAALLHASVVADNGWLRVDGASLVNQSGNPIQLRGVSMGWHCLWPRFYNHTVVDKLARDWHADIVRCAIGLDLEDQSFEQKPELGYAVADSIIKAAIANDIYVIVDFHSHANNLTLAKEFFSNIANKYGKYPNLLYEIWNEPMEVQWLETKAYAEELIPIIRQYAPKNVIIVPTPRWDQNVDDAADDPIVGVDNIMYSLHYYAATHADDLREKAQYALSKNLPIFMSECASMVHTGDGVIDTKSWEQWMQVADDNKISWIAWSISDKDETCSMLRPSASSDASQWSEDDLKAWAVLVKYYLKHNR
jgi:endoglucanase